MEAAMTDEYRFPETDDEAEEPARRGQRWLVVLGVCVAAALLVVVAVLHLTGVVGPQ
jgi:hypothetical protein